MNRRMKTGMLLYPTVYYVHFLQTAFKCEITKKDLRVINDINYWYNVALVTHHILDRDAPIWYWPNGYQFIGQYSLISVSAVLLLI